MDAEPRDQAEPEAGPPREDADAIDRAVHDFVEELRRAAGRGRKRNDEGGV